MKNFQAKLKSKFSRIFLGFEPNWKQNFPGFSRILFIKYYSVCELDIVFEFEQAYHILDEFLLGGHLQDRVNFLDILEFSRIS